MKSPFQLQQYGKSGAWCRRFFSRTSRRIVDDLAFIHSCQGTSNDHVISHYEWNTGSIQMGFPSVGAGQHTDSVAKIKVFRDLSSSWIKKADPCRPSNWQKRISSGCVSGHGFFAPRGTHSRFVSAEPIHDA